MARAARSPEEAIALRARRQGKKQRFVPTDNLRRGQMKRSRFNPDVVVNENGTMRVKGFSPNHPFNDRDNNDKLVQFIQDRMQLAKEIQNSWATRCKNIDTDFNAFLKLSDEDKARRRDNVQGKAPKPTAQKLPLAMMKVVDLTTFMMEVFWPATGMHAAYTNVANQELANEFALLMNKHAEKRGHYRAVGKWFFDGLKYGMAALWPEWCEDYQTKIANDQVNRVKLTPQGQDVSGNDLYNADMYNFYWDPAVHPVDLPKQGEWAAQVRMHTRFHARRMAAKKEWYGVERAEQLGQGPSWTYYNEHPIVRFDYDGQTSGEINWFKFAGQSGTYQSVGAGLETNYFLSWINPSEFGLATDDEFQIWRFVVLGNKFVVSADRMNNAHEMLPVTVIAPTEDNLDMQRKSIAEIALPFQDFASFLMNIHIAGQRKKIYGLQVYDPNVVDLSVLGDEPVGRVAAKPSAFGKDITKAVHTITDSIDTDQTMVQLKEVVGLLETLLPTSMIKNVTDLDRATTFQSQAVVQASNRSNVFYAKMIDDQGVKPLRFIMASNILQFQPNITMIDPTSGQQIQVDMAKFRDLDMDFLIGEGIQSLERIMIIHLLKDSINAIIQNQAAAQQFDVPGLLNYWTDLFGLRTNLNQFRIKQMPPQQQQDANVAQQTANTDRLSALAQAASAVQQGGQGAPAPGGG